MFCIVSKMDTYSKRLKRAMLHANLTQEELAAASGVKQQSIQYLLTKGRSSRYNAQIAESCGVYSDWLATGKGEMVLSSEIESHLSTKESRLVRKFRDLKGQEKDAVLLLIDTLVDNKDRSSLPPIVLGFQK